MQGTGFNLSRIIREQCAYARSSGPHKRAVADVVCTRKCFRNNALRTAKNGHSTSLTFSAFNEVAGATGLEPSCTPPVDLLYTEPYGSVYETRLDASFAALSDATRRGVLEQLSRADASITDLAEKFHMTLTGMKKHVGVLERAALVTTEKAGRVRTCRLGMRALEEEAAWIERHRQLWSARFDELDKIVEHLKSKEKADARRKRR